MPLANRAPKREFTSGAYLYGFTPGDNKDSRFSAYEVINTLFSGQLLTINSYRFADGTTEGVDAQTQGYFSIIEQGGEVVEVRINSLNLNEENNSETMIDFLNINSQTGLLLRDGSGQNIGYFLVEQAVTTLNYISIGISETKFISNFENEEVYTISLELVSNQDNIFKSVDLGVSAAEADLENPEATASSLINNLPAFEITEKQIHLFYLEILGNFFTFGLKDIGKGLYGLSGTPLDATDVLIVAKSSNAFTQDEQARLRELIYSEGVSALSVSPATFEKNLSAGVNVDFNWNIQSNDDDILSATFDGGNILSNLSGSSSFSGVKDSISKSTSASFKSTLDEATRVVNQTKTATALIPQWKGSSPNNTGFNNETYANLGASLSKFIQGSSSASVAVPANQYGVFIINKAGAVIRQGGTGFEMGSSAYTEQSITVEYQDGTILELTQYLINPADGEFTYLIS